MINFTLTITAAPELLAAISNFTSAITSAKVVTIPEANSDFTAAKAASWQMAAPAIYNQPAVQTAAYTSQNSSQQQMLQAQQPNQNQMPQPQQGVPVQLPVHNQTTESTVPVYNQNTYAAVNPAQVQQHTPTQPQNSIVPTSTKSYTFEELAVAATQLVDAGRRGELKNLLDSFKIEALAALPREQYGAFAIKLRALGVKV